MRVLHLDSGLEMRGGQWQALRLHQGLISEGHESVLLAREGSPLLQRGAEPLRVRHLRTLSRSFDLVHAHDARSHTIGAILSRVPLVVSRRVAFAVRNSAVSRWKYRVPALFLAVSRYVAERLRAAGVPDQRIAVVYDGVPVPAEPANGPDILIPDTADPAKGAALAESAAQLAGITLKRSSSLEADMPQARALVYLSHSEGLGSGILLGMAHGLTVIASDVGGIPELIDDGINGILVPNEENAVKNALWHIDPQLGKAARETVLARFTVEHMVRSTVAAYERALAHA
ncbi:MAG TPA: glycosyltransferase family 4 protein [Bryobacteraceae bacterium]|nr:glycosyltransferase family 4 protein [Bryobacteraceae bacterium]